MSEGDESESTDEPFAEPPIPSGAPADTSELSTSATTPSGKMASGTAEQSAAGPSDDLVIGLVGAVGTDLPWVQSTLSDHLATLGFGIDQISLSALIDREYGSELPAREAIPYDDYVFGRMTAGNVLRHLWQKPDAVARLAIEEIRRRRDARENEPAASAFLLRSLKRPEEVRLLRNVYRGQFVLIGCHTPRETRIRQLANAIAKKRSASDLRPHRGKAEELA
ncbi:MAG: hypothetical protein ABSG43_23735, partial [Solirubrobacteraceae bacterium]